MDAGREQERTAWFADRLDAELKDVVPQLLVLDLADLEEARRTRVAAVLGTTRDFRPDPGVERTLHTLSREGAPGVRLLVLKARDQAANAPCLVWLHGGGHVLGFLEQDEPLLEHLVREVGCCVVSVDWRLAPEHPFPSSLEDAFAGLTWVFEHAVGLGIDPGRVAIGGNSSGGGLAAGLALFARDRGGPPICFQLLLYPMLDDRNESGSSHAITDPHIWNRRSNLIAWRAYLGDAEGTDAVSPYAAPARAADLSGLPPAYLPIGDLDLFLDECVDYAQRLSQAGVAAELHVYPGATHGFENVAPHSDIARRFARDRDEALIRAFRHARSGPPQGELI
jgi:acetyl esterase/lipase